MKTSYQLPLFILYHGNADKEKNKNVDAKNKKDEEDSNMISDTDLKHLRRCVELAKMALEKGDEAFGSVLVSANGEVLFEDHNHVAGGDHTQHPEFAIARWAANNMVMEERSKATV